MSIISLVQIDRSDALCGRYAALASAYLEDPEAARTRTAKVPLENLFRLLEMSLHDAFADEARKGVLALDSFGANEQSRQVDRDWHVKIADTIDALVDEVFTPSTKQQAILRLEHVLGWLATGGTTPPEHDLTSAKRFFEGLANRL